MNPRLAAALVLVALLLSTVSGCSRIYRFTGTVVDGDGNPISDARIALYPHDWEQPSSDHSDGTSNGDGGFEATWGSAVGVEYFRMVVSKEGYKDHLRLVEADAKDLRIVLERANNVDLSDNVRMAPNPVCAVWFTFALVAEPIEEARLKRTVEASQAIEVGMTPQDVRDVLGEPKGQYGERGFLAWLLMGYR